MMMVKQILKNEIKDIIGHEPSDAEYKSALKYISDSVRPNDQLTDIALLLGDWRHDELLKCDACGDYFLPEVLEDRAVTDYRGYREIRVCSDACYNDYCEFDLPEKPEVSQHI